MGCDESEGPDPYCPDIISNVELETERLKKANRRLRARLRAVQRYHSISNSDIEKLLRMGYGS